MDGSDFIIMGIILGLIVGVIFGAFTSCLVMDHIIFPFPMNC